MKRTGHQLAPAVPSQEIVDRAVAGRVSDRLLVSRLKIVSTVNRAHMAFDRGGLAALEPKRSGGTDS